uniref:Contactin n=1 Tax=Anopheles coluzzii TaxID=1518534 RepID=A0A8W7PC28_ANOCL
MLRVSLNPLLLQLVLIGASVLVHQAAGQQGGIGGLLRSSNNNPFYDMSPDDDYLVGAGGGQRTPANVDDLFLRAGDLRSAEDYFCPEHWAAFRGTCLRVHKSPRKSWYAAQKICQAYQGELISVDTIEKHSFVVRLLDRDVSKLNRYYVSARQVSPGNWVNADKSQLIAIEDAINYELLSADTADEFQSYFEGANVRNAVEQGEAEGENDPRRYYQSERYRNRNYLVLGFNMHKEKWQFYPVTGEEQYLFVCESRTLYSQDNLNTLLEDRRQFDYGLEQTDVEKIPRGPYFIRQPVDTTYDTGKASITRDVTLSCLAGGYPTPRYTWYKEEYVKDNLTVIQIDPLRNARHTVSGGNLIIHRPSQNLDQGTYHCTAQNAYGKILSESVQLNFGYILEFNLQRAPEKGEENWGKALVCEEPQHYPDVKFYWSRNYFPNFVYEDQRVFVSHDGSLYFSSLEVMDRANYSCTVMSTVSDTGRNGPFFELSVSPSPHYQDLIFANTFPKAFPKVPLAGKDVRLECMTYGYPVASYNWTRRNGNLPRLSRLENYNRVLLIQNATVNDNGEYVCTARNGKKSITQSIFLTCRWTRLYDTAARPYQGLQSSVSFCASYECVAKSSVNRIVSRATVLIQGPPGAPGAVKVIDIKKTEALLEWTNGNDNGRPILYYNILGRTNWNRTWVNVSTHVVAQEADRYNGRRQATVTNLTPWCGYEFAVVAVNDLGLGTPSLPSPMYSTLKDRPYIAPRNVGGGGGKIGDLTITWDPLAPHEQNSIDVHYRVFYRLHGQREWASEELQRQGNVGKAVIHVPTDKYYTRYEVKVQAVNDLGVGPISEPVEIFSAEDMPQVAPQQTIARSFNSTALNVTWVPVSQTRETIRGKLIGHRLKYWKKEHNEEDSVYYLSRTTRPWALIVGLEPDTYYFVKVMAYNAAGEGPESERYLERTYRKAPQKPPSSVQIYGINPSTIKVTWRYIAPSQDEEPVQGYKIRIWEKDQDMSSANDTVVLVGRKLEKYIDNLTPGKSYNLRVLAFSNGGDGRMSSPPIQFQMGITQSPLNDATSLSVPFFTLVTLLCALLCLE